MIKIIWHGFEILKQFLLFLFVFILSLLLFSIISAMVENAYGAEYKYIKIPEVALVGKADILLGDIAEIHIKDEKTKSIVNTIIIGSSPLPGAARVFRGSYLKNLINSKLENHISLIVPERIKIISRSRVLSSNEIEGKIIDFLKQTDVWEKRLSKKGKILLKGGLKIEAISLPDRDMEFKFRVPNGDDLLGATNIELNIFDNDLIFKKIWIRVNIAYFGNIIIAGQDLKTGDVIDESMIDIREITIDNAPSKFYTNKENVLGKRVKSYVRTGFAIMESLIENPPLVNFGDNVKIVADNGFIMMNAQGKSLGKGHMGTMVRVENRQTKKIILAEVSGEKQVTVTF